MTKAPGENPGPSSVPAYVRPWVAVSIAMAGFAVAAFVPVFWPGARSLGISDPGWVATLIDVVVVSAPLIIAVVVAVRVASDGFGRALGIRPLRGTDVVFGIFVGFVARAVVELISPTTGSLGGPFGDSPWAGVQLGATLVTIAVAVIISPVVEELFFRGLALRALSDALSGAGRMLAGIVAIGASTLAFVALHVLPVGGSAPVGLIVGTTLVGLGCGILTLVTGRLGAALAAHMTYNLVAIVLMAV